MSFNERLPWNALLAVQCLGDVKNTERMAEVLESLTKGISSLLVYVIRIMHGNQFVFTLIDSDESDLTKRRKILEFWDGSTLRSHLGRIVKVGKSESVHMGFASTSEYEFYEGYSTKNFDELLSMIGAIVWKFVRDPRSVEYINRLNNLGTKQLKGK